MLLKIRSSIPHHIVRIIDCFIARDPDDSLLSRKIHNLLCSSWLREAHSTSQADVTQFNNTHLGNLVQALKAG